MPATACTRAALESCPADRVSPPTSADRLARDARTPGCVAGTGVSGRAEPSRHDTTRRSACASRLTRFAQRTGRQQPAIADAAAAVDHDDLAIARQTIVLQAVVRQNDLGAALDRAPRGRHAVGTGDDDRAGARRQQHRFVADFLPALSR